MVLLVQMVTFSLNFSLFLGGRENFACLLKEIRDVPMILYVMDLLGFFLQFSNTFKYVKESKSNIVSS